MKKKAIKPAKLKIGTAIYIKAKAAPLVGDVCVLLSGGPKMTVCKVAMDGLHVACHWFDASGRLHTEDFATSSLWFGKQ